MCLVERGRKLNQWSNSDENDQNWLKVKGNKKGKKFLKKNYTVKTIDIKISFFFVSGIVTRFEKQLCIRIKMHKK